MFSFITKPIGCLFSLVGSIVVIALVLIIAALALLSHFMPQLGAKAISEATGFPTTIADSSLSLWNQRLELRDIRVNNPESYPEDDFLSIPRLSLTLDRKATDQDYLTFSDVTLHIDTLTLVRLSGTVLNGSAIIRNLLQNASLSPATGSATAPLQDQPAVANWQTPPQPAPASGAQVHFEPILPLPSVDLPALSAVPVTYAADGTPSHGPRPRWLIRRLSVRIDNARLFASSPQGNFLQLVPLQYQRTFNDVTSLSQVLPALLQDLIRRGLPL